MCESDTYLEGIGHREIGHAQWVICIRKWLYESDAYPEGSRYMKDISRTSCAKD